MNIEQRFQKLNGIIYGKEKGVKIQSINIRGDLFTMKMLLGDNAKTEAVYRGTVKEHEISGTITIQSQYSIIHKNWVSKRDPKSWKSIDR